MWHCTKFFLGKVYWLISVIYTHHIAIFSFWFVSFNTSFWKFIHLISIHCYTSAIGLGYYPVIFLGLQQFSMVSCNLFWTLIASSTTLFRAYEHLIPIDGYKAMEFGISYPTCFLLPFSIIVSGIIMTPSAIDFTSWFLVMTLSA